ncbi:hypothetical protein DFA_01450 [Cavenderia fasciculata]|uniref:Uncharacterized protein n=1 Tax=Cavenderia fasciculata TaxID=261658 RepID=F4PST6_CACFS|nr:uncharacterized protein DFA_01450 [Cavenderia fasciculata]EGG21564.1 hypothetical protein DFA_01450 [Cavenderia fasciculata]|eukprot:XP_004359414.1 hypothetical protein DFA_01450 [Cavenderia fasciculata]
MIGTKFDLKDFPIEWKGCCHPQDLISEPDSIIPVTFLCSTSISNIYLGVNTLAFLLKHNVVNSYTFDKFIHHSIEIQGRSHFVYPTPESSQINILGSTILCTYGFSVDGDKVEFRRPFEPIIVKNQTTI